MLKKPASLSLCALTLPPPVHGMAWINQQILKHLINAPNTKVVNLSAGSLRRGLPYHARRLRRVYKAWLYVWFYALTKPFQQRKFYTVMDGGLGAYYTLLLCGTAHLLGYHIYIHHHASTHTKAITRSMSWLVKLAPQSTHIALCQGMKEDLLVRYPKLTRVIVSDNCCHLEMPPAPEQPPHKGPIHLGMLSNLTVEKGAVTAIETATEAHKQGLEITLTLAGPVVDERVKQAIAHAQSILGDRMKILGPVYGEDKISFFRAIDVFLFPTQYINEAQPLVLLEAMSQGCMVIAYGRGYIPDMLENSEHVIIPMEESFKLKATAALKSVCANTQHKQGKKIVAHYKNLFSRAQRQRYNLLKELT